MRNFSFSILLCFVLAACASSSINYPNTIRWDGQYDVVVIGFGGSGAVASITAADNGASVLLTEKMPEGQGGANLTECVVTGRIAGKNVAKESPYVGTVSLAPVKSNLVYTPGSSTNESVAETARAPVGTNQYLGSALGMDGPVTVRITMASGNIANVEVVSHNETPGIGTKAVDAVPPAIVRANNADVDAVVGATITSRAIMDAVKDALARAE